MGVSTYFEDLASIKNDSKPIGAKKETGASAAAATAAMQENSKTDPRRLCILSWNIDGLDQNNVKNRAKGVADTINQ